MRHCDKQAITVNPTNKCNLRCTYCMASSGQEQTTPLKIDIKFAMTGIKDAIRGHPTGIKAPILRFFSPGEPTQNMECIRECVLFARWLKPDIQLELQTNGLFKSWEDCEFIADHFNAVWFSIDGPSEINGKNRPDDKGNNRSSEILEFMKHVQQKTFVGVRATIVKETVEIQHELIEFFHEQGINYVCANPVIEPITREERIGNGSITAVDLMQFSKGFLKGHQRAKELNMNYVNSLTFNFDDKTDVACRSCLPMPQLNPDGSVSSCDMALYQNVSKELDCFIYGKWEPGSGTIQYDHTKIDYLRSRKNCNLVLCQGCDIIENCAGGCAGRIAYEKGSIFEVIPEYCAATKYLARHIPLNGAEIAYTHP